MAVDHARIAQTLARWLSTRPGVTDVQIALQPTVVTKAASRMPKPPFRRDAQPQFELRIVYKGKRRLFRYFLEQEDDTAAILSTLRVHSNGELMVSVPDEFGNLMPNDIYYGNRSSFAPGLGDPAPNILSRS